MQANCTGPNAAYTSLDVCLGVCATLPPGGPEEPIGNTVACRLEQARMAGNSPEPEEYCPGASFGGADDCGEDCETYCMVLQSTCPEQYAAAADCVPKCRALSRAPSQAPIDNHEGDTLDCRLAHLSAATLEPASHCNHARLAPMRTEWCVNDDETPVDCDETCRLTEAACTGSNAVYESTEQCLAVCAALPPGHHSDTTPNTRGCRAYHAHSALVDPDMHCSHAGPSGDGHCGDHDAGNCESYCLLLARGCPAELAETYASQATCEERCATEFEETGAAYESGYAVASVDGTDTLQCRILHATRALERAEEDSAATTACAAAVGGEGCAAAVKP